MIELKEQTDRYLSQFERLEKQPAGASGSWLVPVRKAAFARFAELGFPTTQHEEWRFTNLAPLVKTRFEPARPVSLKVRALAPFRFGAPHVLVFVNGRFDPLLSRSQGLPEGVRLVSLAATLAGDGEELKTVLARYARYDDHAPTALNTAMMEDGACLHVARGAVVTEPIQLLFVSTEAAAPFVTHPRNLIVADDHSQATVVESFVGLGRNVYFTNLVTEIVAGAGAVLDHYKIVREADAAFHLSMQHLHQERSSNVDSHSITLGGGLVRNDLHAVFDGEGCDCTLNGLYMVSGTRHVDNHLVVEHARPHCDSREYYKGVLDGRGAGIFSGRIIVHKGAQKTDAKQTNKTLLLSREAQVESRPQLEIHNDDVKCTHGATIGQIDDNALFYLRSRGMSESTARSLMVYAFAQESVEQIRVPALRAQFDDLLFDRLPQGELLRASV